MISVLPSLEPETPTSHIDLRAVRWWYLKDGLAANLAR